MLDELLRANQAFYDAHEARDYQAMQELWDRDGIVHCTHPGWSMLSTWPEIGESWRAILEGPGRNQFIITNLNARVDGHSGWVACDENIVSPDGTTTIAALNVFVRVDDRWLLTAHHGSPVFAS